MWATNSTIGHRFSYSRYSHTHREHQPEPLIHITFDDRAGFALLITPGEAADLIAGLTDQLRNIDADAYAAAVELEAKRKDM